MTTHTTPIDLRPFHGREFEGVVPRNFNVKGRISVNKSGRVYLCQNEREGENADDKLGFKYSWIVQRENESTWETDYLDSITILDEPKPINPEWDWKDGEIVRSTVDDHEYEMNVFGKIVIPIDITLNKAYGNFTFKEAYVCGFRKLPPPQQRKLVEITEEVFRSTVWYGKKVMYGELEQGVYAVHYNSGYFTLVQSGTIHYSQCKLIEE